METEQKHNRPPQEYIDCYNKIRSNIFNFLELQEIKPKDESEKEFIFIIPEISLTTQISLSSLELNYVFSQLNKNYPNFREWFKGKVNEVYEKQQLLNL